MKLLLERNQNLGHGLILELLTLLRLDLQNVNKTGILKLEKWGWIFCLLKKWSVTAVRAIRQRLDHF